MPEIGFITNPHLLGAVVASALIQFAVITAPGTRAVIGVTSDVLTVWPTIAFASLTPVTATEVTKLVRRGLRGSLWAGWPSSTN
jgi:hypothetical protein